MGNRGPLNNKQKQKGCDLMREHTLVSFVRCFLGVVGVAV